MAERRTVAADVAGSSPVFHPTKITSTDSNHSSVEVIALTTRLARATNGLSACSLHT